MADANIPSPRRILLIDDDEDDREIFLEVVVNLNPSIVLDTAINGAEGFDKLISSNVLPAIVFLDLNMPVVNGTEFLRKIRGFESLKNIPIIILSTTSDDRSIKEALDLGAKDFIKKPDKFKNWETALRRFIT